MYGIRTVMAAASLVALLGCGGEGAGGELVTFRDSASYAIGLSMGGSLEPVRDSVALDRIVDGLRDAALDRDPKLTDGQMGDVLRRFTMQLQAAETEQSMRQSQDNVALGDAYRMENGVRAGVTTTASGLQFEVLEPGSGARPKATDRVTVHYRGTLTDGTEFDSSHDTGQPATFAANQVIAGWTEALQLMQVGGRYRLVIPPDLAYGEQGAGPVIGANATLVFEVDLLRIEN